MAVPRKKSPLKKVEPLPPLPYVPPPAHAVEAPESFGIMCPRCGCRHFEVLETRKVFGARIRRRRECRHCGRRIVTHEKLGG